METGKFNLPRLALLCAIFFALALICCVLIIQSYRAAGSISVSAQQYASDYKDKSYFETEAGELKKLLNYQNAKLSQNDLIKAQAEVIKVTENIFKDSVSLKFSPLELSNMTGLKVYEVKENPDIRVIRCTFSQKAYGENNNPTYELIQTRIVEEGRDYPRIQYIVNGQERYYDNFNFLIHNSEKKLLCTGTDYSVAPSNAAIQIYDIDGYNYTEDGNILNSIKGPSGRWNINTINGAIGLGNDKNCETFISDVEYGGRQICVEPTFSCNKYMGNSLGRLVLYLTDDGYVPIVQWDYKAYRKPQKSSEFISSNSAVSFIKNIKEVRTFCDSLRKTHEKAIFVVDGYPTEGNPVWTIKVCQDLESEVCIYNSYKVNAKTGKILKKEYAW